MSKCHCSASSPSNVNRYGFRTSFKYIFVVSHGCIILFFIYFNDLIPFCLDKLPKQVSVFVSQFICFLQVNKIAFSFLFQNVFRKIFFNFLDFFLSISFSYLFPFKLLVCKNFTCLLLFLSFLCPYLFPIF